MNNQEFKENMILLIKQIELLTYEFHMKSECVCEVKLNCMGYKTTDRFNSSMSFEESDIEKIAVSLVSSFFADYFQSLSLKVNK